MRRTHVHIGHHFFGAGNLGDDLMLAGFLQAASPEWLERVTLTCCTPHDLDCQRRRFPQIEWLPYDPAIRADCIQRSHAWLGLADTPFQATGGHTWFLDHLCEEAAWCRRYSVPMFYLGVGINERAAVTYPQTRILVEQAERIWMRDDAMVEMLRGLAAPGKVTAHADLAHLALAEMHFPAPEPTALGLVLNFEDPTQFHPDNLADLVQAANNWRVHWLVQEVRPLLGSETQLYGELPSGLHPRAPLRTPDYTGAPSARALLTAWEGMGALFVSRYHASLVGAWMGARVVVFARNDKVASAAQQLGLPVVAALDDATTILSAVAAAQPVEHSLLQDLAGRAREACKDFFAMV